MSAASTRQTTSQSSKRNPRRSLPKKTGTAKEQQWNEYATTTTITTAIEINPAPNVRSLEVHNSLQSTSSMRGEVMNVESANNHRISVQLVDYSDSNSEDEEDVAGPSNSETKKRELSPEPEKSSRPDLMKYRNKPERSEEDLRNEKLKELYRPKKRKEEDEVRKTI